MKSHALIAFVLSLGTVAVLVSGCDLNSNVALNGLNTGEEEDPLLQSRRSRLLRLPCKEVMVLHFRTPTFS